LNFCQNKHTYSQYLQFDSSKTKITPFNFSPSFILNNL
jgi:hypothetical protein